MAINVKYSIQILKYIYTPINALAVVMLLGGGYFNILAILETSGCLSSELYIYSTIFMSAMQNCDLFLETVASVFFRLARTVSSSWICSRINLRILESIRVSSYIVLGLLILISSRKGKYRRGICFCSILVVMRANWATEFIVFWGSVVILSNSIGVWNVVISLLFFIKLNLIIVGKEVD